MEPVDLIIFGASGDLSARKLFPALFQLDRAGLLQEDLRIAAIARHNISLEEFLQGLRERMNSYMGKVRRTMRPGQSIAAASAMFMPIFPRWKIMTG